MVVNRVFYRCTQKLSKKKKTITSVTKVPPSEEEKNKATFPYYKHTHILPGGV